MIFLKNLIFLFITSILIFGNWSVWIYAVNSEKIIDASFGYFIFPILSVFFGILFLKEAITSKVIISLIAVIIGIYIVKKGSKIKLV